MSRRTWIPAGVLVGTCLLALASAAPALGDTTIGHTGGNVPCFGGWVAMDTNYVVPPGGGVITSFSYGDDGADGGAQLDFEVLRPNFDGTYTIVADTGLETLSGAVGDETFSADIAVSGGDVIGYYETGTDNCLQGGTLDSTSAVFVGSDPSVGQTLDTTTAFPFAGSVNESATFEAATPTLSATGGSVSGTEGAQSSGQVATFSDPDSQSLDEYSATITWGDGTTSAGVVSEVSPGQYAVSGAHVYAEYGAYTVDVGVSDQDGTSAQAQGTATIADAGLSASGVGSSSNPAASQPSFSGQVASLSDQNQSGSAGDFTATIDWGDGTTSVGTVVGSDGSYAVSGSHTYAADRPYTVHVHVVDDDGSFADATSNLVVYENADPSGAGFGIGDRASGPQVYFWGSRWAAQNPMSGGGAPASFKGYDDGSAQSCGARFTAAPGSSSRPPARVPSYTAVAVMGAATKSGAQITGTVEKIVVVETDPGYSPAGQGTGRVVATVCG